MSVKSGWERGLWCHLGVSKPLDNPGVPSSLHVFPILSQGQLLPTRPPSQWALQRHTLSKTRAYSPRQLPSPVKKLVFPPWVSYSAWLNILSLERLHVLHPACNKLFLIWNNLPVNAVIFILANTIFQVPTLKGATQGWWRVRGQTKSSLRTSDQYCRPSVWEGAWARRLLTAASVQNMIRGNKKKNTHRRTPTQTQKPCRNIPSRHTSTELIIPHPVMVYWGPTMANM